MTPNAKERDDILANLSSHAYALYDFYLSKAGSKQYDYSDTSVHRTLNYWKLSRIKAARLQLTKAGYFRQVSKLNNSTRRVDTVITHLGKRDFIRSRADDSDLFPD